MPPPDVMSQCDVNRLPARCAEPETISKIALYHKEPLGNSMSAVPQWDSLGYSRTAFDLVGWIVGRKCGQHSNCWALLLVVGQRFAVDKLTLPERRRYSRWQANFDPPTATPMVAIVPVDFYSQQKLFIAIAVMRRCTCVCMCPCVERFQLLISKLREGNGW